jgi:hypothetical protein
MKARHVGPDLLDFGKLFCLRVIVEFRLGGPVPVPPFLQCGVVKLSAQVERCLQSLALLTMGVQSILEGLS